MWKMHMKNAYESSGYWINSGSAKKKCGEWTLDVSNENYGCLTNGRFEKGKKMGVEKMVEVYDKNPGYWIDNRAVQRE